MGAEKFGILDWGGFYRSQPVRLFGASMIRASQFWFGFVVGFSPPPVASGFSLLSFPQRTFS